MTAFGASSLVLGGFTIYQAPYIQSEFLRFAIAGTVSTVFVELLCHGVDTLNMRAKVETNKKQIIGQIQFIKKVGGGTARLIVMGETLKSLLWGIQTVLYGYLFSSMVYFYVYARIKDAFKPADGV